MERKLAVIVDNNEEVTTKNEDREMCSSACDGGMEMCSSESIDTCRKCSAFGEKNDNGKQWLNVPNL